MVGVNLQASVKEIRATEFCFLVCCTFTEEMTTFIIWENPPPLSILSCAKVHNNDVVDLKFFFQVERLRFYDSKLNIY